MTSSCCPEEEWHSSTACDLGGTQRTYGWVGTEVGTPTPKQPGERPCCPSGASAALTVDGQCGPVVLVWTTAQTLPVRLFVDSRGPEQIPVASVGSFVSDPICEATGRSAGQGVSTTYVAGRSVPGTGPPKAAPHHHQLSIKLCGKVLQLGTAGAP